MRTSWSSPKLPNLRRCMKFQIHLKCKTLVLQNSNNLAMRFVGWLPSCACTSSTNLSTAAHFAALHCASAIWPRGQSFNSWVVISPFGILPTNTRPAWRTTYHFVPRICLDGARISNPSHIVAVSTQNQCFDNIKDAPAIEILSLEIKTRR